MPSFPVPDLNGVFPVLATPFRSDGSADEGDLRAIVRYAVEAGADGVVFPGVASEFDTMTDDERMRLAEIVADELASRELKGRAALVIGASSGTAERSVALARHAGRIGAACVMVMAPKALADAGTLEAFYRTLGAEGGLPIMLQNAPAPIGAGLPVETVVALARAVPEIAFVKEETLPCGQRITQILDQAPPTLRGVFGGAGGRYITDELARGAVGTMPACELTEIHVALVRAFRGGDAQVARGLFNRMLPLLNFQAVFRMAMTKEVLRRRGIIHSAAKRAAGPSLDAGDLAELETMLAEVADLLPARRAAA